MWFGRKLAQGVGGWLQFEYHCHRSEVFSEKYLSVPIGQVLAAAHGTHAYAEFKHPLLSALSKAAGRRPEIDFVVCDTYPNIKVAVESKWVGKDGLNLGSVIWDLIRLEMLHHHYGAEAYFILGGRKRYIDKFMSTKPFVGKTKTGQPRPVLRKPGQRSIGLRLHSAPMARIKTLKKLFATKDVGDLDVPERIGARSAGCFPTDCRAKEYQIYVWEVTSATQRNTFKPSNHAFYK
jgi:hypothetical protein